MANSSSLVARQHRHIRRFAEVTSVRRMRRFYEEAASDLGRRLRRAVRGDHPFEAQHYRALLQEVRVMLRELGGEMAGVLGGTARDAMIGAARGTVQATKRLARLSTGLEPRFAIEQAAVLRNMVEGVTPSLLRRYQDLGQSSWAAPMVRRMERTLALGLAEGVSTHEIASRLMDEDFVAERWRADRIARTEAMYATGASQQLTGRAMAHEYPGLKKKFVAVIDLRTSAGHLALHGTVIPWGASFVDPATGRSEKFPPLRPNCRCSIIPWHEDWEPTRYLEEIPERVQRGIFQSEEGDGALRSYRAWAEP